MIFFPFKKLRKYTVIKLFCYSKRYSSLSHEEQSGFSSFFNKFLVKDLHKMSHEWCIRFSSLPPVFSIFVFSWSSSSKLIMVAWVLLVIIIMMTLDIMIISYLKKMIKKLISNTRAFKRNQSIKREEFPYYSNQFPTRKN